MLGYEIAQRIGGLEPDEAQVGESAAQRLTVDLADAQQQTLDAEVLDVRVGGGAGQQETSLAASDVHLDRARRVKDIMELRQIRQVRLPDYAGLYVAAWCRRRVGRKAHRENRMRKRRCQKPLGLLSMARSM